MENNCVGQWETIEDAIAYINHVEGADGITMGVDAPRYTFSDKDGEWHCHLTPEELVEKYNDFNEKSQLVVGQGSSGRVVCTFVPEDVATLKDGWSEAKCASWLADNSNHLHHAMCEAGWTAMESLMEGDSA